jgi:signal transduction histidine kinase
MKKELQFKVSSALKDIIGKDLITDDFIAVFELVKNSFDAYATQVDIYFEGIYSDNPKIIIIDNGKGMSLKDIESKWLFVAYSAKKDGSEDESFDYRDKIYVKRAFAGAKGIGRFSCDRLGKTLYLESTKKKKDSKTESLYTEWEKFEENTKDNFIDISVLHETKKESDYNLKHGTALEITNLRSPWDRDKLLKLKDSLAKLINPNVHENDQTSFSVNIHAPEEEAKDLKAKEYFKKVNGEVKNFIFETLGLKTTKIYSSVSEDGKFLNTYLTDGGTLIYKIKEKNQFSLLKGIDINIYYLNRSAKTTFARRMGVPVVNYGHIFLYKNGFRIYPYGEPGEDPLKIDKRKGQGYSRYLGTREVIGQIDIVKETEQLKETSSRGDGLIRTNTYLELEQFFWNVLKRLEKYVVDVQKWGLSIEKNEDNSVDLRERVLDFILKISETNSILDFEYSDDLFNIIASSNDESVEKTIESLDKIASTSSDSKLISQVKKAVKKLTQISTVNEELIEENKELEEKIEEVTDALDVKEKEVELLKEASNEDIVELMTIEHHINQASFRVDEHVGDLFEIASKIPSHKKAIVDLINKISLENKKMASLIKFVRKANIDLLSSTVTEDLVIYIKQYIKNVYKKDYVRVINKELIKDVNVEIKKDISFIVTFVPLEINIILDNLLDNSFKASATKVNISLSLNKDELIIDYLDNGTGIPEKVKNNIFDFGISTTSGSGIGLYHIKKILNDHHSGDINFVDAQFGANFKLKIKNRNDI